MCLIRNPEKEKPSQTKPRHPLQGEIKKSHPLMKHKQIYLFKAVVIRIKKS